MRQCPICKYVDPAAVRAHRKWNRKRKMKREERKKGRPK